MGQNRLNKLRLDEKESLRVAQNTKRAISIRTKICFQPSQDLSPIYEEINGVSRSSISGTSVSSGSRSVISTGSSGNQTTGNDPGLLVSASGIERGKFYYALYQFNATEPTMMSLYRGKVSCD